MSDPFHLLDHYAQALLAGFAASARGAIQARLPRHRLLADTLNGAVAALDPALRIVDPAAEARRRRAALLERAPALKSHAELLDHCVTALGDVLSGEKAGTDVIFPRGSVDLVAPIYHGTAWTDHFNRLSAEATARMAEALVADGVDQVRILELGAGTGGTSSTVLKALAPFAHHLRYDYTDVSPGFVTHGRARFGAEHTFADFRVLDIERPPVAQGFEAGAYHVVVATNVLHATRRIDETLRHTGQLLAPGGALVLNEVTRASLFGTLTFGLLDGWWRFEDADARLPGAPLLDQTRWAAALDAAGFTPPACFGWQGSVDSFQTLLISEWCGQERSAHAPVPAQGPSVPPAIPAGSSVAAIVARVLGLDLADIEADRPLAELGVDSIVAGQLATALADALGVALAPSEIYDCATLAGLERHLAMAVPVPLPPVQEPSRPAAAPEPKLSDSPEDVAVIGIACRFPGAANREEFWQNLVDGVCSITEVPAERWDWRPHFSPTRGDGHTVSRWGGFLDGHDLFDPEPFRITHGEARAMSPQQRLFLETAWHALEDAGYGRGELAGTKCGVFVGVAPDGWGGNRADTRASLGDSNAILSARLAYALDLKGSCLPIDTACSSSLVAVHLAARSLIGGDNSMALAGGVSVLMTSPRLHVFLTDSGMASPTGLCRTFDAGADGFVPGEGVGVVVLKRLAQARTDGDHIYAVIKASGVNQDGTTSGITAPNGPAQTALEREVYDRAGISASSIGLVEAHGTGTRLGDPIEVNAIGRAFRADAAPTGACLIGSVKSNIGHTLAAAGIAGFIKAALAVERGVVPPSLHYVAANPEIDFTASPFRVATASEPWEGRDGLPRRAAISSFGFSGTNAHVVLEAPTHARRATPRPGERLITVSAKTAEALDRRLVELARFAAETTVPLAWLAWTATVGRTHFEHRAAIRADSSRHLSERASGLAHGRDCAEARRAIVTSRPEATAPRIVPTTPAAAAAAYLTGQPVDLAALFDPADRVRVPMPGYPFDRLRFTAPATGETSTTPSPLGTPSPHRLIGAGEKGLNGSRFPLTGATTWPALADHRHRGRSIWPAAAIVEAMWAAGRHAGTARFELGDVTFQTPLTVGAPAWLTLEPAPEGGQVLRLNGAGDRPHASARLLAAVPPSERRIDVAALGFDDGIGMDAGAAYTALAAVGFDYGPAFRSLTGVRVQGGRVLADLMCADTAGFDWPPGLIDGAIQSAVGMARDAGIAGAMSVVPQGISRVRLHGSLAQARQALVERRPSAPGRVCLDISLLDPMGRVLAELSGLEAALQDRQWDTRDAVITYEPYWRVEGDVASAPPALNGSNDYAVVLPEGGIPGGGAEIVDAARQILKPAADAAGWQARFAALAATGMVPSQLADLRPLPAPPAAIDDAAAATAAVQSVIALIAGWQLALPGRPLRLIRVYPHDGRIVPAEAALESLAHTLEQEAPGVSLSLLGLDPATPPTPALVGEFARPGTRHIMVQRGQRLAHAWRPVTEPPAHPLRSLGKRPVIIVTGARSGLGRVAARHLAQTRQARLVLVSRRAPPASEASATLAQDIARLGGEAVEVVADIATPEGARHAVEAATTAFGRVDAVIHAAGVTRDGLLRGRAPDDVAAVLAPKVTGTTALLRALAGQPVRAFVCYGSLAAVFGNPGQGDYGAANGFMAALAERDGLPLVTIDWPFWREGGLRAREGDDARLRATTGTRWLETAEGLAILDRALAAERPRFAVAAGDPARIARLFMDGGDQNPEAPTAGTIPAAAAAAEDGLPILCALVTEVAGTPPARLHAGRDIEDLALDSMHITQLNDRLEQTFGPISKTLFYECRTLGELAARLPAKAATLPAAPPAMPAGAPVAATERRRPDVAEPIAIIGFAGRFPGADDLDAYWANLMAGRDCVTDVPADRWDHALVFDPVPGRPGKAYARRGGFLSQVDGFDPLFFGIAPAEAERMDPQERLVLETAWEAMEDAGLTRATLAQSPDRLGAVYVGVMYGDYQILGAEQHALGNPVSASSPYWSIPNRLSYALDLHGPSLAVDSACSSSLTALHFACRSLWSGEAEVALAGGVNLSLHPLKYVGLSQGRFASTDGRCRSFGTGGDGYVPGEGVAIAILKPLAAALAHGDRVHGVIRGSAINHGGRTNGYTVPSPAAQASAIRTSLASAGLSAGDLDYIEAHGTGTALGDPIEIEGLRTVLAGADTAESCPIGTVKSSIGHLEAAAGMAGLAKLLLQFRHGMLAPTVLHGEVNPAIDLTAARLRLVTAAEAWRPRRPGSALIAGISSFGAGGANAHLIVEAPPPAAAPTQSDGPFAFVISARTQDQLRAYVDRLNAYFSQTQASAADIARTLQVGREAMPVRLGLVAHSLAEARERLRQWRSDGTGGVHFHVPADEDGPAGTVTLNGSLEALVAAWVRGATVSWPSLGLPGRRVFVPPRPFMRRRHWPVTISASPSSPRSVEVTLDPAAAVIGQHRVGGKALVPAALLLGLAQDAAGGATALRDVILHRPAEAADAPLTIRLRRDGANLRLEAGNGVILLTASQAASMPVTPIGAPAGGRTLTASDAYRRFDALGIDYGPAFRRLGDMTVADAVVEAAIMPAPAPQPNPDHEAATALDAAMQAAIALVPQLSGAAGIPYRIDQVTWHDAGVLARTRVRATAPDRFDIDGLADTGALLVSLRGLQVRRPLVTPSAHPALLAAAWSEVPPDSGTGLRPGRLLVVRGPGTDGLAQALAGAVQFDIGARDEEGLSRALQTAPIPFDSVAVLCAPAPGQDGYGAAAAGAEQLALGFLDLARALTRCPADRRPNRLVVITTGLHQVADGDLIDPVAAAIPAMARTLAVELPALALVLVDLDATDLSHDAVARALAEPASTPPRDVAWRTGRRFERQLARVEPAPTGTDLPPEPVCVITGGGGGLGRALAAHIAARPGARVVLCGRRPALDGPLPAGVSYIATDIRDAAAVARLFHDVRARHGRVDAVFHLPLVLADRRLNRMSDDDFLAAFTPKAAGTANVLAAARQCGARMVVFSSANVFAGADGQSNYVAGTAVQDALALSAGPGVQVVSWGLWGEIGAVADAATQARLAEAGIQPIQPAEGFQELDRLLRSSTRHAAVVKAAPEALQRLGLRDAAPHPDLRAATAGFDRLEAYGRARLLTCLTTLAGADRRTHTPAGLARRIGVAARHGRLFDALLAMLDRHGLAKTSEGVIRLPTPGVEPAATLAAAASALDAAMVALPWLSRPRALLDAALDRYGALLTGGVDPLDVLFPGGSGALVEGAYRGNPLSDGYNAAAAAAVAAHRAKRGPGWRAIEVGAGTGGTTGAVLAALDQGAAPESYLYTDLSRRFLDHGSASFGPGRSWFATALYDIERPVEANGLRPGDFDTVIAANVLHTATDLPGVLTELRRLLKPGGLLVVVELIAAQDYGTLVFGLTDGWWKAADTSRIAHSPVVDAAGWERRLIDAGFDGIERRDLAASGGRGQAVFLATVPARPDTGAADGPIVGDGPRQALLAHLRGVFAEVLRLDPAELRAADPFERYGLESLSATAIRNQLDARFGALSQTLLFEFNTLGSLADHLLATRGPAVQAALGIAPEPAPPTAALASPAGARVDLAAAGKDQPIAIVGMAGRFPGADTLDAFWQLLEEGRSAIDEVPAGRWAQDGRSYTSWGGFLRDIDQFDPLFFGIAPTDAAAIDPQERLFLQVAWHAMEQAGYTPARLNAGGPVGVYVGVMNAGYQWLAARIDGTAAAPATSAYWSIANRLSFVGDFSGPSLAVDTACSSSLTALHLAAQAIRAGDCAAAIVGGVNLIVHPRQMANLCEARMLSAGPENRAFGAGADGFVDGEGVAALLLKPLEAAIADGDRIEAVIRATAINAGGKTAGFSVPNPSAQAKVIADALRGAGITPDSVGFVEAHGTGTALGDPIEVVGIAEGYGGAGRATPLVLGALKANIGHLESAAGIAGVVKTVLQLRHARIAPMRHADDPNPLIDFAAAGCVIPAAAMPWPAPAGPDGSPRPRRAGVSSFGAGGANAHVVLEEAPAQGKRITPAPTVDLLTLSAADEPALRRLAASLKPAVAMADARELAAILHTLRIGRRSFALRTAAVVTDPAMVGPLLDAIAAGQTPAGLLRGTGTGTSARRIEETAEGRRLVDAMLTAGDAGGLAELWVDGVTIDWTRLPWAAGRPVVALPGYPFARERYWLDGTPAADMDVPPAPAATIRLIHGAWSAAPLPRTTTGAERPRVLVGSVLLRSAFDRQRGTLLAHRTPGNGFDPADASAWAALVEQVDQKPADLLIAPDALPVEPAAACQVVFLALQAAARRPGRIGRLVVAADGAAATLSGLAALARSAMEEGLKARVLWVAPGSTPDALAALLAEEADAVDDETMIDRRRARGRWSPRWLDTPAQPRALFRRGGRYLIAGGLGAVGRALAAHLVQVQGATVGILGRTAPNDTTLRRLKAIGPAGSVHYAAADLTDPAALSPALSTLKQAMGGIDGVLDLARLVDNAPIARKETAAFTRVLAVKVAGTVALDAALAAERLDFFIVFSSLAAWYGLAGGADYAAACAIQEGLMTERVARVARGERHGQSLAVAWPQWRYDDELDAAHKRRLATSGFDLIDIAAGIGVLERAAASGEIAVAAVSGTAAALAPLAEEPPDDLDTLSDSALAAYVEALRTALGNEEAGSPSSPTLDLVRSAFAERLRIDPARFGDSVSFADLGLDSVKALHVAERLSRDLGIDVEPALFLDHPTADRLAAVLDQRRATLVMEAAE
ncbi:SDR family NAD(P)-dependent oxidoreductase [Azospirillum sp. B4]|uniref:SDR family NAD(P)-dependent oxidoreductase n=1 Tax=Azospirillum sp. B4 TaxID=95605 RepID=UPI00034A8C08|nr:SDR family NAD(P)-dependent oxidoreductase [Azospirillum sp. B4]